MNDFLFRMYLTVETDFGLNMLRNAPVNDSLVVSPISVIFALAMVQAGAKALQNPRSTQSSLRVRFKSLLDHLYALLSKRWYLGASDNDIEEHYSKLSSQIMNASHGVKSRIANGFFLNKQFHIEKDYEQAVVKRYGAKVEALDFGKAKETAKVIDDFISKTTEGKIRDFINEDSVRGIGILWHSFRGTAICLEK
ncbi:hypothetical protein COOONC_22199 [Cooperia oncophora]